MTIKKLLKNQKGASSVMVIFLLIVLTTLGAFAIVSSNVNFKFGTEVSRWNENFYNLEKEAEYFIFEMDKILANSENISVNYIINKEFLKDESEFVSNELQSEIKKIFSNQDDKNKSINEILNKVYFYNINKTIDDINKNYESVLLNKDINNFTAEINFNSAINNKMNMKLKMKIIPVNFEIENVDNQTDGYNLMKITQSRFEVIEKREWQAEADFDNKIILWDGKF